MTPGRLESSQEPTQFIRDALPTAGLEHVRDRKIRVGDAADILGVEREGALAAIALQDRPPYLLPRATRSIIWWDGAVIWARWGGRSWSALPATRGDWHYLHVWQSRWPVPFLIPSTSYSLWLYNDAVYLDRERMSALEVEAILNRRRRQRDLMVERVAALSRDEEMPRGRHVPAKVRAYVFSRDDGACVWCGRRDDLSLDHIIPWSLGGSHDPSNLVTSCMTCNRARSNRIDA